MNCIFCEINEKDYICENDLSYAIYDKFPVNKGHILIIPKRHFPNYFNATSDEIIAMNELIHILKEKIDLEYSPDGYNIGVNINEAAGQTIYHMHIHMIPRYLGDQEDPRGGIRKIKKQIINYKG